MRAILDTALRRRGMPHLAPSGSDAPWDASYFGLDRVAVFRQAPAETRRRILAGCAEDVLREAVGVERLGLTFAARMVLLAETTEARMTYSLFGADEAMHLAAIGRYLASPEADTPPRDPFLCLLTEAINEGPRLGLAFVVQVVLEGWGLVHYGTLSRECRSPDVAATFAGILRDEALHHGAGRAVLRRDDLPALDHAWTVEVLVRLLEMVQAGPQRVVDRLTAATGPLSRGELARVFEELHAEADAGRTLDLLRNLMRLAPAVVTALDRYAAFAPFSPERCAATMRICEPQNGPGLGSPAFEANNSMEAGP